LGVREDEVDGVGLGDTLETVEHVAELAMLAKDPELELKAAYVK
jgi:hypothetical protein